MYLYCLSLIRTAVPSRFFLLLVRNTPKVLKGLSLYIHVHMQAPKLTYLEAAKVIKRSKRFMQKWVERYKATGIVDDLPERGNAPNLVESMPKRCQVIMDNSGDWIAN